MMPFTTPAPHDEPVPVIELWPIQQSCTHAAPTPGSPAVVKEVCTDAGNKSPFCAVASVDTSIVYVVLGERPFTV
jgi:hypothetical protein